LDVEEKMTVIGLKISSLGEEIPPLGHLPVTTVLCEPMKTERFLPNITTVRHSGVYLVATEVE